MVDNSEFYNRIVNITKLAIPKKCSELLNRDADAVSDIILRDYKDNIEIAATHGRNLAYLCFYEVSAIFKDDVPLDYFIHMTEKIKSKFEEYSLEPVESRLRTRLQPFELRICSLSECEELKHLECEAFRTAPEMVVISVSWK
jgi:hypothetical protein